MNKVSKISRVAYMSGGAMLAACAAAADLTLYADDGYQGRALNVVIDERELSVRNFNDRASSVVIESGAWVLCSGDDFGGKCVTLEPGRYASLRAVGLDDDVSSVRHRDPASIGEFKGAEEIARAAASAEPGTDIVLYADDGYAGRSHSAGQPQADLQSEILQGKAASVVIAEGEWELCDDTYYRGQCVTLGPGKYPSLKTYGLTRGASSVRHAPPH